MKNIKPITAWAVVDDSWMGNIDEQFYIYFSKSKAKAEAESFDFSVIKVKITPI